MQPFEGRPGGMISIDLGKEIEAIKQRLTEMGETFERVAPIIRNSGFEEVDNPIAPYKIKRAKSRKQKRKTGGPR